MKEFCYIPISGGYFVSQLAQISKILEARYLSQKIKKPHFDVYFTASGGSLTSVMSTFFYKNSSSVERVLGMIKKDMFVKSWVEKGSFLQSFIFSFFREGLYKSGEGAVEMFESISTQNHFLKSETPEIWISTFNVDEVKTILNCTKPNSQSLFKNKEIQDSVYLNGERKKIIKTVMASTSIPGVKEKVKIEDKTFVDGGVSNATPGTFFNESIIELDLEKEIVPPYHYYYLMPYNFQEKTVELKGYHWILNMFNFVKLLTFFSVLNDRKSILENWFRITKTTKKNCDVVKLKNVTILELKDFLDEVHEKDYFITLYTETNKVNITDFNDEEMNSSFKKCFETLSLEILIKQ